MNNKVKIDITKLQRYEKIDKLKINLSNLNRRDESIYKFINDIFYIFLSDEKITSDNRNKKFAELLFKNYSFIIFETLKDKEFLNIISNAVDVALKKQNAENKNKLKDVKKYILKSISDIYNDNINNIKTSLNNNKELVSNFSKDISNKILTLDSNKTLFLKNNLKSSDDLNKLIENELNDYSKDIDKSITNNEENNVNRIKTFSDFKNLILNFNSNNIKKISDINDNINNNFLSISKSSYFNKKDQEDKDNDFSKGLLNSISLFFKSEDKDKKEELSKQNDKDKKRQEQEAKYFKNKRKIIKQNFKLSSIVYDKILLRSNNISFISKDNILTNKLINDKIKKHKQEILDYNSYLFSLINRIKTKVLSSKNSNKPQSFKLKHKYNKNAFLNNKNAIKSNNNELALVPFSGKKTNKLHSNSLVPISSRLKDNANTLMPAIKENNDSKNKLAVVPYKNKSISTKQKNKLKEFKRNKETKDRKNKLAISKGSKSFGSANKGLNKTKGFFGILEMLFPIIEKVIRIVKIALNPVGEILRIIGGIFVKVLSKILPSKKAVLAGIIAFLATPLGAYMLGYVIGKIWKVRDKIKKFFGSALKFLMDMFPKKDQNEANSIIKSGKSTVKLLDKQSADIKKSTDPVANKTADIKKSSDEINKVNSTLDPVSKKLKDKPKKGLPTEDKIKKFNKNLNKTKSEIGNANKDLKSQKDSVKKSKDSVKGKLVIPEKKNIDGILSDTTKLVVKDLSKYNKSKNETILEKTVKLDSTISITDLSRLKDIFGLKINEVKNASSFKKSNVEFPKDKKNKNNKLKSILGKTAYTALLAVVASRMGLLAPIVVNYFIKPLIKKALVKVLKIKNKFKENKSTKIKFKFIYLTLEKILKESKIKYKVFKKFANKKLYSFINKKEYEVSLAEAIKQNREKKLVKENGNVPFTVKSSVEIVRSKRTYSNKDLENIIQSRDRTEFTNYKNISDLGEQNDYRFLIVRNEGLPERFRLKPNEYFVRMAAFSEEQKKRMFDTDRTIHERTMLHNIPAIEKLKYMKQYDTRSYDEILASVMADPEKRKKAFPLGFKNTSDVKGLDSKSSVSFLNNPINTSLSNTNSFINLNLFKKQLISNSKLLKKIILTELHKLKTYKLLKVLINKYKKEINSISALSSAILEQDSKKTDKKTEAIVKTQNLNGTKPVVTNIHTSKRTYSNAEAEKILQSGDKTEYENYLRLSLHNHRGNIEKSNYKFLILSRMGTSRQLRPNEYFVRMAAFSEEQKKRMFDTDRTIHERTMLHNIPAIEKLKYMKQYDTRSYDEILASVMADPEKRKKAFPLIENADTKKIITENPVLTGNINAISSNINKENKSIIKSVQEHSLPYKIIKSISKKFKNISFSKYLLKLKNKLFYTFFNLQSIYIFGFFKHIYKFIISILRKNKKFILITNILKTKITKSNIFISHFAKDQNYIINKESSNLTNTEHKNINGKTINTLDDKSDKFLMQKKNEKIISNNLSAPLTNMQLTHNNDHNIDTDKVNLNDTAIKDNQQISSMNNSIINNSIENNNKSFGSTEFIKNKFINPKASNYNKKNIKNPFLRFLFNSFNPKTYISIIISSLKQNPALNDYFKRINALYNLMGFSNETNDHKNKETKNISSDYFKLDADKKSYKNISNTINDDKIISKKTEELDNIDDMSLKDLTAEYYDGALDIILDLISKGLIYDEKSLANEINNINDNKDTPEINIAYLEAALTNRLTPTSYNITSNRILTNRDDLMKKYV